MYRPTAGASEYASPSGPESSLVLDADGVVLAVAEIRHRARDSEGVVHVGARAKRRAGGMHRDVVVERVAGPALNHVSNLTASTLGSMAKPAPFAPSPIATLS